MLQNQWACEPLTVSPSKGSKEAEWEALKFKLHDLYCKFNTSGDTKGDRMSEQDPVAFPGVLDPILGAGKGAGTLP